MTDPTIAEHLGTWASGLKIDAVPEPARAVAKDCLMDTLGAAFAGTKTPSYAAVWDLVTHLYGEGPLAAWGVDGEFPIPAAALLNGTAAHALDFDDTSYAGVVHGTAAVAPAVLAMAEATGAEGKDALAAFIAGVEISYALGDAFGDALYFRGWWPTGVLGAVGAAAGVARVMGMDAAQTTCAIGHAASQSGMMRAVLGTHAKPILSGRTAELGVIAASLAAAGASAPADVFENATGMAKVMNDGILDRDLAVTVGTTWRLIDPGIAFKPYPSCSATHAAASAVAAIMAEEKLTGADIERVEARVTPLVAIQLTFVRPQNTNEAQFCLPFVIGCLLAYGHYTVAELSDATLTDPALLTAMDKVAMSTLPEPQEQYADGPEGAVVEVVAADGRRFERQVEKAPGNPENPLAPGDLEAKFRACMAYAGADDRADMVLAGLRQLDQS